MSGDHNMYCSGNQPDSEALKLAEECFKTSHHVEWNEIEAFYRAAYNKGIEDAANAIADYYGDRKQLGSPAQVAVIRALKEEV